VGPSSQQQGNQGAAAVAALRAGLARKKRGRGKCGRAKEKEWASRPNWEGGKRERKNSFSFSEMTFPNTFSNDFQTF
jgi:hypothetical protein